MENKYCTRAKIQIKILLKYKESVPDRTKINYRLNLVLPGFASYVYACVIAGLSFHIFFFLSPCVSVYVYVYMLVSTSFFFFPLIVISLNIFYKYRNNVEGTRTVYLKVSKAKKDFSFPPRPAVLRFFFFFYIYNLKGFLLSVFIFTITTN